MRLTATVQRTEIPKELVSVDQFQKEVVWLDKSSETIDKDVVHEVKLALGLPGSF